MLISCLTCPKCNEPMGMASVKADVRHPRHLVVKAIKEAERAAGKDNIEFLRALRASYFSSGKMKARGVRSIGVISEPQVQDLEIYRDPRFAKNARLLAERAKLPRTKMRILGGTPVRKEAFPDCVAVGTKKEWKCSGTLISPEVVLTAGHCTAAVTRIYIGENVKDSGRIVHVKRAIPHPNYSFPNDDLMILILDSKIKTVTPRLFATTALIQKATDVRAVGFGATDKRGNLGLGKKRMVDIPVASNNCSGKFKGRKDEHVYGCNASLELVAGRPLLAKDTCEGDSGGPIYVSESKGGWYLAGVTSRETNLRTYACGDGGIYLRADKYRGWIESELGFSLP